MQHYRFDKPNSRFIGRHGDIMVYADTMSRDAEETGRNRTASKKPGEFHFYYGPATGGLVESIGFRLTTPGEAIVSAYTKTSYKRRNIRIRGFPVEDALLRVERINGFHSASHTIAFLKAVEDASGIEASREVEKARIAAIELERIRSNLEVIKRLLEPAGFGVPMNQVGYLREKVTRIISEAFGHRFFFGSLGVNSASIDAGRIQRRISGIKGEFARIFDGLQNSKIFLNRLQNNGVTKSGELVGPAARAASLRYDARIDSPTLDYGNLDFEPVVRDEKDCFGRFMVRGQEILDSAILIEGLGDMAPTPPDTGMNIHDGEGAARLESPAGDLFYHVDILEGKISDIWLVPPSRLNVDAFERSMSGNIFTDFHFNWESFGIWASEMEVEFK